MRKIQPPDKDLPQYIADAIRKAWPDDVVDIPNNSDDAPLMGRYARLKASVSRIPGARVLYEREPVVQDSWSGSEDEDEDDDFPGWDEESRSYCLLFVSPEGSIGWVVGISVVGRFAAVSLDQYEIFESGSLSEPDVEPHMFSLDGGKLDLEGHCRKTGGEEGLSILENLRSQIVRVLKTFRVTVIPEVDLERPVPWLRATEETLMGHAGEPITVRQAFFYRWL